MSRGVSVLEVYVPGGKCPGGICPGGKCLGGKCPGVYVLGVSVRGVHVQGGYVLEPIAIHTPQYKIYTYCIGYIRVSKWPIRRAGSWRYMT